AYLLEDANRFFEPAGALNVLTVGSLAHGEGLNAQHLTEVMVRPITRQNEPSPFSRIGPGVSVPPISTRSGLVDPLTHG
ncbi:hypothetical protein ACC674_39120, partial [Rhizobium ruizarguesonis]